MSFSPRGLFQPAVYTRWLRDTEETRQARTGATQVSIDPARTARGATVLELTEGPRILMVGPQVAAQAAFSDRSFLDRHELAAALETTGLTEDEEGLLYYLPREHTAKRDMNPSVRQLSASDQQAFSLLMDRVDTVERDNLRQPHATCLSS